MCVGGCVGGGICSWRSTGSRVGVDGGGGANESPIVRTGAATGTGGVSVDPPASTDGTPCIRRTEIGA